MAVKKETQSKSSHKYVEGVGRRKTATARVRLSKGEGAMTVNEKPFKEYFQSPELGEKALQPLTSLKLGSDFGISAKVQGGGIHAQAEAVRHGLARALTILDPELKTQLRSLGYLTRDSRMVERKKYGLRKARRAPQWQKR